RPLDLHAVPTRRSSDLFLIEAVVLSEVGGIIGILLGLGIGKMVDAFTPVPAAVPIWTVFLGLIFCSFVGLIFGVYPAMKAARMRSEEHTSELQSRENLV